MKKYLLSATIALLGAIPALADEDPILDSLGYENYLYCKSGHIYYDDWVVVNEKNEGTLILYLHNVTEDFNSFMFDIFVPEGYSIAKKTVTEGRETREVDNIEMNNPNKTVDHSFTTGDRNEDVGHFIRVLCYSLTSTPIYATSPEWGEEYDRLMNITFKVPDDFNTNNKQVPVVIKNIEFAAKSNIVSPHYMQDVPFTFVTNNIATGVDNVKVDGVEVLEGVYDLYGRRYDNAENLTPGVYVVNGVKQLIK